MTKKHFIALADVIRAHQTPIGGGNASFDHGWRSCINEIEDALEDFCANQNPRFNRQRWLDYIAKGDQ